MKTPPTQELHPVFVKLQADTNPMTAAQELLNGAQQICKGAGIDVTFSLAVSGEPLNHDLWVSGMKHLHIALVHLGLRTRSTLHETINKLKALPHVPIK